MQILAAGGIKLLTDSQRPADINNPRGYYEFEPVKHLAKNANWLPLAQGKAVKIISTLLPHLPLHYHYKIIFMEREMKEILASQRQMLLRKGEKVGPRQDTRLSIAFSQHLRTIKAWLRRQKNFAVLYINYNRLLNHPNVEIAKIGPFLDVSLNVAAMPKVIDPRLYRQRATAKTKALTAR